MSNLPGMQKQVARGVAKIFRRLYIKRRTIPSGNYETDWLEITQDVLSWGSIRTSVDPVRRNKFTFSTLSLKMDNTFGRYDDSENPNSIWYGYMDHQRTLVKIETGFVDEIESSTAEWDLLEYPGRALWDEAHWDVQYWDEQDVAFVGMISGDVFQNSEQTTSFTVAPLTEVFRQRAAANLSGYGPSLTASGFMEMVRDHQDAGGNYVFRPFFGDTTTGWEITATTQVYSNLNTSTADDLANKTVWDVMSTLAEAEDFVVFVKRDGTFVFADRAALVTASAFDFFGGASFSSESRVQIKKIQQYGNKYSSYYSRVRLTFRDEDTTTSYRIAESQMTVGSGSVAWQYGERTLEIENKWIPTSTVADTLVTNIFNNVSEIRKEIRFSASFVPHLDIYDRISVTFDPTPVSEGGLWDLYDWASTTSSDSDLVWDASRDTSMFIDGATFELLSIDLNLDTFETVFVARED